MNALNRLKEEFIKRKTEIANAIALETGKPLWESMTEASALGGKVDATINHSLKRIDDVSHDNIMPNTDGKVHLNLLALSCHWTF